MRVLSISPRSRFDAMPLVRANVPSPSLYERAMPASILSHSASAPAMPVVTSPSSRVSSTSASKPNVAIRPQAANAGAPLFSSARRWNALPTRSSRAVGVNARPRSRPRGSPETSVYGRSTAPGSAASVRLRRSSTPPTVTRGLDVPANRAFTASRTWLATVRPNRASHGRGIVMHRSPPGRAHPLRTLPRARSPPAMEAAGPAEALAGAGAAGPTVAATVGPGPHRRPGSRPAAAGRPSDARSSGSAPHA